MTRVRLRDGSGEIDLKYLYEDVDRHGNVRLYFRKRGRPKIRLRETPGTEAFFEEFRAAMAGKPKPKQTGAGLFPSAEPGSLRWLTQEYYKSSAFKALEAGYVRRRLLDSVCQERFADLNDDIPHGDKPYKLMKTRHVRRILEAHADRPEGANNRLKALRALFAWAVETERADANPTRDVMRLKSPNRKIGFHTWTVAEVRQFEDRHPIGTKARLAMGLLMFTGVRRSDVVRLGRQMERDGWLYFTETKGRKTYPKDRAIPILPELRTILDATQSGHLTYLVTSFGKPFTANGFGNKFRAWCNEAGLPHCSAHGLRKAGATIAAERGATTRQLMAIYGWLTADEAELYTRAADRKRLAGEAMHLIVPEDIPAPATGSKKERT